MGIRLTVNDESIKEDLQLDINLNTITLTDYSIDEYEKALESPNSTDTNAYLSDEILSIELSGKIDVYNRKGEIDELNKLSQWAKFSAHEENAYRSVEIELMSVNNVVYEKLSMEKVFIVSYEEELGTNKGSGIFRIVIRELEEDNDELNVEDQLDDVLEGI